MADLTKTIEIVFGGKDETSKTIGSITGKMDGFAKDIGEASKPLADLAGNILKVDAALAAMVVGGMAYAIKTAGEFSGQFGEITTLIKDTGEPIEQFKKNILDYSTGSVKSIEQINQAVYSAISAGVDYKDSLDFVSEAEKLSVAGRADLGATTKALISTMNAYGASTDQAGKYSDIMFTTVRLGQTTIEELSSSLSKVTGIAASTGVPFETLSAAIAALTVSGAPTSEAITGIKAALTNIIKPTKEAQEMADSLGIQFNATALKTKGFEGVLKDVYEATGGSTEKMAKLFGSTEALNAVFVLGADKTGKFKDALKEMGTAAGATKEAYDKVANEFENINQRLENNFKATIIAIGSEMLPGYGKIAGSLADLFKGIKVGVDSGAFDPLFKYLDATAKSISIWLTEVGKAFPDAFKNLNFKGLIDAFKDFGDALAKLFQTDKSKPEALAKALQLVIDSVESLIRVTQGIGEPFAPIINFAKITTEAFNSLDEKTKVLIGNVLGLSLAFKAFGPMGLVMIALGSDTELATRIIRVSFAAIENGINALKVGVFSLGLVFASATLSVGEFLDNLPGYENSEGIQRAKERVEILARELKIANTDLEASSKKVADAYAGVDIEATKFKKTVETTPTKITTELTVEIKGKLDLANIIAEAEKVKNAVEWKAKLDIANVEKSSEEVVAKIKATSEIINNTIEWKGRFDIAELEAGAKKIEAIFGSIDNSVTSTGGLLSDLFKTYADNDVQGSKKWAIEDEIKKEVKHREEALELQKKTAESEMKYNDARREALSRGDAMITINGDGLQPHLEAFMFEILAAIQIKANQEGAKFLVGI
ncbi:MAG: phage tail tape measure protein [Proteobacteria bacterium]|nr:phage tail tape measure protein [Pseudomonadota bacterium]